MIPLALQKRFRHLSLNQKAILVLVSASICLSIIASSVFFALEYRESLNQFQREISAQANRLAEEVAPSLVFLDEEETRKYIDTAMGDDRVRGLMITEADGSLFAQRMSPGVSARHLGHSREPLSMDGYTSVSVVINYHGQEAGQLTLLYDTTDQNITGAQFGRLLITFLVSSFVVIALILLFLHRYTTRPIVDLAEFARRISLLKQYEERVPDDGRTDEIGTLSLAINDMLDAIGEGQQKLENYAGELESLVALRTEQLNRRANFDQLTGLPNRYQLMDRANEILEDASHLNQRVALLLIDLDRFKNINDSLGHHAGDMLLCEVSRRITDTLDQGDFLARLGGDEFVVILPNIENDSSAIEVASRLMEVIRQEIHIEQIDLRTSASIGISIFPDHGSTHSELLKCADISMYSSKETGRGTSSVYSSMMATHTRRLQLEAALSGALERGEFELVYQPQIEFFSGRIAGFEALLRWRNEELDNPLPDEFISIAEETSYIHEITRWVIETAAHDISLIQSMGLPSVSVAINVSANTLLMDGFASWIADAMERNRLDPGSIEIEITEDIFLAGSDNLFDLLKGLQESGIRIAIDDFGTRYSSLLHLVGLPLDTLKVDSQFIAGIETSNKHRNVVSAIISLAHGLGLRVVAEGVEVDAQRQFLRVLGCDLMQGYLLHEPASCREIVKTITPEKNATVTQLPASG